MNARYAIAPLGILEILILIGVLFGIIALLRNPNGRKIFLTLLTVLLVIGGVLFAGIFSMRVAHIPGPNLNSLPGPRPLWNLTGIALKPLLLLGLVFLVVGAIRFFKNHKIGAGPILIIVVLLIPILLFFFIMPVAYVQQHSATVSQSPYTPAEPLTHSESTVPLPEAYTSPSSVPNPPAYTSPSIWQESIAGQFTADVYPSKARALKSLRPKVDEALRKAAEGKAEAPKVVLFAAGLNAAEIHSLMDTSETETAKWTIEPLPRNLQDNEISIAANFSVTGSRTETRNNRTFQTNTGILEVSVYSSAGQPSVSKAKIEEKPWLEDLSGYQSAYPNSRYLVARSQTSVTDEKTAEWEAFGDACNQVAQVLREMNPSQGKFLTGSLSVNQTDLEGRGMIVDRFSQQLYGMAGPICRSALLVDLSPEKIQTLANAKFAIVAETQKTWMRVLLSFVGMAVVIALVYAFLNAATRGYYSWSLRIAAVVLLGVGVVIVLSLAGHFGLPH